MATQVQSQQPVVFTTRTPYPLPTQKYLIPTSWRRYHLSQLVNKALSLANHVPFDFIIRGQIMRTSLADWCAENAVGEEETLEIEYVESVMPPQKVSDFPHEDWVSAILCDLQGYLLTASYDGHVRAFDYSKSLLADTPLHSAPITSLDHVSSPNDDPSTVTIVTSSQDLTAAISQVTLDVDTLSSSWRVLATLHLHIAPVSSVVCNDIGTHLLTSSWDGLIGLWDTAVPPIDQVPEQDTSGRERNKRRRKEDDAKPRRKAPINVLKSHTARVSKVAFASDQGNHKAYSCSFDSTVRIWDTESAVCTHTISAAEKPFLDLSVTHDGRNALAVSTDRTMTMYDLRSADEPTVTAAVGSFLHPATPSCISISKGENGNSNQVVTGAYDGIVRVWDLRSTKSAVASFKVWEGNEKVLDVDWKRGIVGVAGEGGAEMWKVGEEVGGGGRN